MNTGVSLHKAALMAIGFTALPATATLAQTPNTAPASAAPVPATVPAQGPVTMVYVPQLPGAAELVKAAAVQGMTVDRIEQSNGQVTAVYKLSNGQLFTVMYQPLPPEETAAPAATTTPVPYATPAPVYYYPNYYYPGYYWPYYVPVSIGLGFAWGWHGGYGYHR